LSDSVRFTGQVTNPTPLYHSFDLFALGSDTEQMPFSVIEAMAAGLAVAATDVGDIKPMLSPENSPYVAGCDDVSLAESLRALLYAPRLRSCIGAANRAKAAQEYDQEKMFRSYAALLDVTRVEQIVE
jgi:glycosyltransferase involved in cell wall biosynthesis